MSEIQRLCERCWQGEDADIHHFDKEGTGHKFIPGDKVLYSAHASQVKQLEGEIEGLSKDIETLTKGIVTYERTINSLRSELRALKDAREIELRKCIAYMLSSWQRQLVEETDPEVTRLLTEFLTRHSGESKT